MCGVLWNWNALTAVYNVSTNFINNTDTRNVFRPSLIFINGFKVVFLNIQHNGCMDIKLSIGNPITVNFKLWF